MRLSIIEKLVNNEEKAIIYYAINPMLALSRSGKSDQCRSPRKFE